MQKLHISLTDDQKQRLGELKEAMGFRTFSNTIGRLIDLEYESRAAYQERATAFLGAQDPEQLEPITK